MDIEKMEQLADFLDTLDGSKFDMATWVRNDEMELSSLCPPYLAHEELQKCGTAACVAGWTCALWPYQTETQSSYLYAAQSILDLDNRQAKRLFQHNVPSFVPPSHPTPAEAASVIREMVKREVEGC